MGAGRTLDGTTVAVIGASGGLGRPIVDELRRRGATVVTASRSGEVVDVQLDLRDAGAGDLLLEHLDAQGLTLDGVVVAAGIVAASAVAS